MTRRAAVTAVAIACAIAIAGCGLGAGKSTSGVVTLTVTRGFGTAPVGSVDRKEHPGVTDRDADARAVVQGHDAL